MTKRERLTNELLKAKADGLRVFINKPDEYNYSNYGIMTDGESIVYVQFGECGSYNFVTSFEYVPSRENGSGCQTLESGYAYNGLSMDVFVEAVEYGKNYVKKHGAKLYRNFEHFFEDIFRKNHYVEL